MESELLHLVPNRFRVKSHVIYLLIPIALFVLVLFFVEVKYPSPQVQGAYTEAKP